MKIIKRNGTEVTFDPEKIANAVRKANNEVSEDNRLTEEQIDKITKKVTALANDLNRAVNVEEVQDFVENQIMNEKAFAVARKYITYRYTRALVRRANTTDAQILTLIECNNEEVKQENSNKNPTVNSVQRDYMAGEVSKDLTRRILLPPDIVAAHDEGLIHFHDADYFAQHMHNCDLVNLEDMLQNGTVISGTFIEKPHSFSTACNIATQIIAQVASNQYGGQSISLTHLAPFVDVSRQKIRREVKEELAAVGSQDEDAINKIAEKRLREEIKKGIQTIQYQVVGARRPCPHHRRDAQPAHPGRQERIGRVGDARLPQAHLRPRRGQRARREQVLVSHRARRKMHRKAHGARLHLRKEDARV